MRLMYTQACTICCYGECLQPRLGDKKFRGSSGCIERSFTLDKVQSCGYMLNERILQRCQMAQKVFRECT